MRLTGRSETRSSKPSGGQPDGGLARALLGPDDFRRIGLSPQETRLAVIRHAASEAAKSLAQSQLDRPDPRTERQLSRVALSTYRLLDPRQREDRQSRAHVGRIRAGALQLAGRTAFFNDGDWVNAETRNRSAWTTSPEVWNADSDSGNDKVYVGSLNGPTSFDGTGGGPADSDSRPGGSVVARLAALRGWATRPALIWLMILMLLVAALLVWCWGQDSLSPPSGFVPHSAR
jgi:hypothetical protein